MDSHKNYRGYIGDVGICIGTTGIAGFRVWRLVGVMKAIEVTYDLQAL